MAENIGIIGAGAWGTALAIRLAGNGHRVTIWSRGKEVAEEINSNHKNEAYLPGIELPEGIKASTDFSDFSDAAAIFLAVPAQHLRAVCADLALLPLPGEEGVVKNPLPLGEGRVRARVPFIICSKGIEETSLKLMSEVVAEIFPAHPIAILSGPNFASEVAAGLPAAATLACADKSTREKLTAIIGSNIFRIYQSGDVIGAETGGALKNIHAIACGIALGKGYGENARAALITRSLAETTRLAVKLGARPETLMGLSGLGDLVLTCSSLKSRNMSLGFELGRGRQLVDILAERGHKVTEGVASAHAAKALARKLAIEMPIVDAVYAIIHEKAGLKETITALLSRKLKEEF